jgi:hypothetical protein
MIFMPAAGAAIGGAAQKSAEGEGAKAAGKAFVEEGAWGAAQGAASYYGGPLATGAVAGARAKSQGGGWSDAAKAAATTGLLDYTLRAGEYTYAGEKGYWGGQGAFGTGGPLSNYSSYKPLIGGAASGILSSIGGADSKESIMSALITGGGLWASSALSGHKDTLVKEGVESKITEILASSGDFDDMKDVTVSFEPQTGSGIKGNLTISTPDGDFDVQNLDLTKYYDGSMGTGSNTSVNANARVESVANVPKQNVETPAPKAPPTSTPSASSESNWASYFKWGGIAQLVAPILTGIAGYAVSQKQLKAEQEENQLNRQMQMELAQQQYEMQQNQFLQTLQYKYWSEQLAANISREKIAADERGSRGQNYAAPGVVY